MKLSVFLQRRDGLSRDEFRAWWLRHVDIARHIPGLRGYRINFVDDVRPFGIEATRVAYDGTAELWFQSDQSLANGFESHHAQRAVADADSACGRRVEFETEEHIVLDGPVRPEGLAKVVVLLRRRPDLTHADFEHWWLEHVNLSQRIPGLRGYRVNLVNGVRGAGYRSEDVEFDGSAELWFDNVEAIDRGFDSDLGRRAVRDSELHCASRIRYVTREHVVV